MGFMGWMFGETTKDFFLKQIKGRGYVDVGTSVISGIFTRPLLPKGHDFLKRNKKTHRQQAGSAGGVRSEKPQKRTELLWLPQGTPA